SGIFFTGGNQLRISTLLGGTPVAQAIRACNARGVHVGGTSAGASILSEHMIAFGKEGASPTAGSVRLAPGLGLTNRFVIDQHFRQRDRLGRLLAALAYNPFLVGIGLDEDTAAFIRPDNTLEVEGSGAVTVVDASDMQFSSMDQVSEDEPVCLIGLKVHILVAGATYNLATRTASAGSLVSPKQTH
ncbi:MAG: cyanophycinase, partial [Proteobacteria bacterium]|nr:cyanophycinase [Pseudomonadota bacterium]